MSEASDPRNYFAAEQALLAWIRTGLAVMGFGFVISRFGIFLRYVSQVTHTPSHLVVSSIIGVAMVVLGVLAVGLAAIQHLRFCRTLAATEVPPKYWTSLGMWFAGMLAVLGTVMAIYLIVWAEEV
jgi:putative membrane protein